MLRVDQRADPDATASDVLLLSYDDRKRSRLRARTQAGREVAIVLSRGSALRDGDLLAATGGEVLLVRAAPERVSEVHASDARSLARVAYHLGNRHVALQVGSSWLRYQHDHVLDEMVQGLGLGVLVKLAVFEPEGGAYGGGHRHAGEEEHEHSHEEESVGEERDEHGEHASGVMQVHVQSRESGIVDVQEQERAFGSDHAHDHAHDHDHDHDHHHDGEVEAAEVTPSRAKRERTDE